MNQKEGEFKKQGGLKDESVVNYDAIIIGSGIGGMSSASALSQIEKKKVLVLEKHWTFGGMTHEFTKEGYEFSSGLHYLGNLNDDDENRVKKLFDFIMDNRIVVDKMRDDFDHFIYPDFTFKVRSGLNNYKDDLIQLFKKEEKAINRFFQDVLKHKPGTLNNNSKILSFSNYGISRFFFSLLDSFLNSKWEKMSFQEYLDENFKDQKLKLLLSSQWGNQGCHPEHVNFRMQAIIISHYIQGSYFPRGGSKKIAQVIKDIIKEAGGEYKTSVEVLEIIVEKKKAIGVRALEKGEEKCYYAPIIISDTGVYSTYRKLLKEPLYPELEEMQKYGNSGLFLFLGLDYIPKEWDFNEQNYWIFNKYDNHNLNLKDLKDFDLKDTWCFVSSSSSKNKRSHKDNIEILLEMPYELFAKYKDRPKEYYDIKEKISDNIIATLEEKVFPGLKQRIKFKNLASPLTFEKFSNKNLGMFYGLPYVKSSFNKVPEAFENRSAKIKHLYLSSGDIFSMGIIGAMVSGIIVAALNLKGKKGFLYFIDKLKQTAIQRGKTRKLKFPDNFDEFFELKIHQIYEENPNSNSIVFDTFGKLGSNFAAGSHIKLYYEIDKQIIGRAYSVCYLKENKLKIIIQRENRGLFSNEFLNNIKQGDMVYSSGIRGNFSQDKNLANSKKLFLLGSGVGITPLFALADEALQEGKIVIFFYQNLKKNLYLKKELDELKEKFKDKFNFIYLKNYDRNDLKNYQKTNKELLQAQLAKINEDCEVMLCGSSKFMDTMQLYIKELNFEKKFKNIKKEVFQSTNSLKIDYNELGVVPQNFEIKYEIDKKTGYFFQEPFTSILDSAIQRKINIDYSCKNGECKMCKCKLKKGKVFDAMNQAVIEKTDSQILACQSLALNDNVYIKQDKNQ